jgi:hypothetical protein
MRNDLVSLFAGYLRNVTCMYCGCGVHPSVRDAENEAEHQILCCGARSIDDLKESTRRVCCACDYFLNKGD